MQLTADLAMAMEQARLPEDAGAHGAPGTPQHQNVPSCDMLPAMLRLRKCCVMPFVRRYSIYSKAAARIMHGEIALTCICYFLLCRRLHRWHQRVSGCHYGKG